MRGERKVNENYHVSASPHIRDKIKSSNIMLLVVIALFCVLKWTKLGRSFYAVGGNSQSALMLGINVKRTKFIAHLLCGVLAGIGGFVYFLHVGSGSPSHASGAEMNAIAALSSAARWLTGGVATSSARSWCLVPEYDQEYRLLAGT